eukprot:CFRG1769T1
METTTPVVKEDGRELIAKSHKPAESGVIKSGLFLLTVVEAQNLSAKDEYMVALNVNSMHRGHTCFSKKTDSPYWNSSFVFKADNVVNVELEIRTKVLKKQTSKMTRKQRTKSSHARLSRGRLTWDQNMEGQQEQLISMDDESILKCRFTYSNVGDIDASLASQNLRLTYVKVVNARHLKCKNGACDTYCILQCEKTIVRTHVITDSCEPTWNCGFLMVTRQSSTNEKVKIRVLDRRNVFLGQTRVYLDDIPTRAPGVTATIDGAERWRDLEKKNHKPKSYSMLLTVAYNLGSSMPNPDALYAAEAPTTIIDTYCELKNTTNGNISSLRCSPVPLNSVDLKDTGLQPAGGRDGMRKMFSNSESDSNSYDFDNSDYEQPTGGATDSHSNTAHNFPQPAAYVKEVAPAPTTCTMYTCLTNSEKIDNAVPFPVMRNYRLDMSDSQLQRPVFCSPAQQRRSSLDESSSFHYQSVGRTDIVPVSSTDIGAHLNRTTTPNLLKKAKTISHLKADDIAVLNPSTTVEQLFSEKVGQAKIREALPNVWGGASTISTNTTAIAPQFQTRSELPTVNTVSSGGNTNIVPSIPARNIGPNMCAYVKVCEARSLPQWPLGRNPRSFVSVSVADRRATTKRLGEKSDFGSHSHQSAKWNEIMLVPVTDKDGTVDIKVYTEITSTVMRDMSNAVGKVKFPIMYLPVLPAVPTSTGEIGAGLPLDIRGSISDRGNLKCAVPALSLSVSEKGLIKQEELQQIGPNKFATEPLTLWLTLEKPKRTNPYMEIRAKRRTHNSHGELKVQLCLVPAPEEFIDQDDVMADPGDPDGEIIMYKPHRQGVVLSLNPPPPNETNNGLCVCVCSLVYSPTEAAPIEEPESLTYQLVDETLPCSVTKLRELIIDDEKQRFFSRFAQHRKYQDLIVDGWTTNEAELRSRRVQYLMQATSLVKANTATETQVITMDTPGGFVIDLVSTTPDVPFGGSFNISIQILANRIDDGSSHLRVSGAVIWLKNIGFMKKAVENGSKSGIKDTYEEWCMILKQMLTSGGKGKEVQAVEANSTDNQSLADFASGTSSATTRIGTVCLVLSIILNLYLLYFGTALRPHLDQPSTRQL